MSTFAQARNPVIVHADSDDWLAVYDAATGALLYQGHSIEPAELCWALGITCTDAYGVPLGGASHFPRTLREVPGFGGPITCPLNTPGCESSGCGPHDGGSCSGPNAPMHRDMGR